MKIKYTGGKPFKTIKRMSEENGYKEYQFAPVANVNEPEIITWLLSPDMNGLFVVANKVESQKEEVWMRWPKQSEDAPVQDTQAEDEEPVRKKRGRRKKGE